MKIQLNTIVVLEEDGSMTVCLPYDMRDIEEYQRNDESIYPLPRTAYKSACRLMVAAVKAGRVNVEAR